MVTHLVLLDQVYNEIVHWRNIFPLPIGRNGKLFVAESSWLFNAGSSLKGYALKATMSFPTSVLQKPFSTLQVSDHILCIERRLKWLSDDLTALLKEGR